MFSYHASGSALTYFLTVDRSAWAGLTCEIGMLPNGRIMPRLASCADRGAVQAIQYVLIHKIFSVDFPGAPLRKLHGVRAHGRWQCLLELQAPDSLASPSVASENSDGSK